MRLFWGSHQRFFRALLMAFKVPDVAVEVLTALSNGLCCVIGLQSTGESAINQSADVDALDPDNPNPNDMDDFVSAPQMILRQLVSNYFPTMIIQGVPNDFRALCQQLRPTLRQWQLAATAASAAMAAAEHDVKPHKGERKPKRDEEEQQEEQEEGDGEEEKALAAMDPELREAMEAEVRRLRERKLMWILPLYSAGSVHCDCSPLRALRKDEGYPWWTRIGQSDMPCY
jgi:hypothetical protein